MSRVSPGHWAVVLLEAEGFSVFVCDLKANLELGLPCPFHRGPSGELGLPLCSGQREPFSPSSRACEGSLVL